MKIVSPHKTRPATGGLFRTLSRTLLLAVSTAALTLGGGGCCSWSAGPGGTVSHAASAAQRVALREKWGIEITGLRMSGHGHLIDFRYRVLDPAKAVLLADAHYNPCLIDQATGTKLKVPNTPKMGPLRQSAKNLEAGRIYFMLFANSGLLVKPGCKVTVLIGDFKVENLTIE